MAVTADLTLAEVAAKCTDSSVATYVSGMDALPTGVALAEFLAKFLQACAVAQVTKNALNTTATVGELLDSYPLPTTGTVQTDTTLNIQSFDSTYQLNVVSIAGLDTSVPSYA
ncbi:MAG TPA: hypothetical protein VE944_19375 [Nostoc sp.]|uniref:hypothetical protein n=1 Tax=Nostoc sp. TaxID=1180 RepID=UPI002D6113E0|nr:hypothetical protein [Nostoc sp.]HYX16484.1 hypothetical protein [Nostoc sp.]